MSTIKRLLSLFIGSTLAALGIAMVTKSGLGTFSITCANLALTNWFPISIGVAGMIVDTTMLLIATKLGEGIGWTSIVNATYTSFMIDLFMRVLPTNTFLVVGLLLVPVGWSLMGKAGLGDTASNILMNALLKTTNKSIGFIRGTEELICMIVGFLGARYSVTWFTIALTLGLGYLLEIVYKVIKYDPVAIEHSFIIKGKRS